MKTELAAADGGFTHTNQQLHQIVRLHICLQDLHIVVLFICLNSACFRTTTSFIPILVREHTTQPSGDRFPRLQGQNKDNFPVGRIKELKHSSEMSLSSK